MANNQVLKYSAGSWINGHEGEPSTIAEERRRSRRMIQMSEQAGTRKLAIAAPAQISKAGWNA